MKIVARHGQSRTYRQGHVKIRVTPEHGWLPGKRWTVTVLKPGDAPKRFHDIHTRIGTDPGTYQQAARTGLSRSRRPRHTRHRVSR
jgi:hypothetical protein